MILKIIVHKFWYIGITYTEYSANLRKSSISRRDYQDTIASDDDIRNADLTQRLVTINGKGMYIK